MPRMILSVPQAVLEALVWSSITYWLTGPAPEASRFCTFWLINALMHLNAVSLFRLLGAVSRTMSYANAISVFVTLLMLQLGGFVIPKSQIGGWWIWFYWVSPLTWAQRSLTVNEFRAAQWQVPDPTILGITIGDRLLEEHDFPQSEAWIWAGVAYMVASHLVMNIGVMAALTFLSAPRQEAGTVSSEFLEQKRRALAADPDASLSFLPKKRRREKAHAAGADLFGVPADDAGIEPVLLAPQHSGVLFDSFSESCNSQEGSRHGQPNPEASTASVPATALQKTLTAARPAADAHQGPELSTASASLPHGSTVNAATEEQHSMPTRLAAASVTQGGTGSLAHGGSVQAAWDSEPQQPGQRSTLAFQHLCLTFRHVWYSVPLPKRQTAQADGPPSSDGKQLYLLKDVSGAFRPGVLTALVGASGAGKTTLMDVLAGRKTAGRVQGDIRMQGHPKEQATFARISGYVEQNDIHSPQTTVHEALLFSASLRLPGQLSKHKVKAFAREIMGVVELEALEHSLVGLPGRSGLSVEQRKRLTIAVELVANPSIIFMDEPTSGLDARAAAIVMRAVRNTVDTGRTVVCTIHQPSIDIFESFQELCLMKRGGRIVYMGPLGKESRDLIAYMTGIEGVPSIEEEANPAAWVLEVTAPSVEQRTGQDFADIYEASELYRHTMAAIDEASQPHGEPLRFPSRRARGPLAQFRACVLKSNAVMWRSPEYNAVRLVCTLGLAIAIGSAFFGTGDHRDTRQGIVSLAGSAYAAAIAVGIFNACAVQPAVAIEKVVFIRERAAGMYSIIPYALAQVLTEVPYLITQTVLYSVITYPMLKLEWTGAKFGYYALFQFLTLAYMTLYGIAAVALTPNEQVAAILSGTVYFLEDLLCGFIIPAPAMPMYIKSWLYWANPVSWTVYGVTVSQLGDVQNEFVTKADGSQVTVADYVREEFGFRHDWLGIVTATMVAFCICFWLAAVLALRFLKFHKR